MTIFFSNFVATKYPLKKQNKREKCNNISHVSCYCKLSDIFKLLATLCDMDSITKNFHQNGIQCNDDKKFAKYNKYECSVCIIFKQYLKVDTTKII